MGFSEFSIKELLSSLTTVGISEGDIILVHSSLLHLGQLSGGDPQAMPHRIISALTSYIGKFGTLVALAPNYDYSNKGIPFDTRHSPVAHELGVLSAALAAHPDAERSANPIFSLAALGAMADHICNGSNASAFGSDSAWDRAVGAGAKILLLGSSFERLTIIRYIEQCAGVPYLYVKLFSTKIYRNKVELPYKVTALLRYPNLPINYDLSSFERELCSDGIIKEARLGGGEIKSMDALKCVRTGIQRINNDIHFFLAHPPPYIDCDPHFA